MEKLEKLVTILKLTQHRQPELVKEAANRLLSLSHIDDSQISIYLKAILEIFIQYCDTDESAQRSLFNDYFNCIIAAFQYRQYQLILDVLVDEVVANGPVRRVTAALVRIPQLINNVQPIELGCNPQKLLKALIEIARRSNDESVQRSLYLTLKSVMPYLDYHIRTGKDTQFLANSLMELLLRNLFNDSSQIRRIAASSISSICSFSDFQTKNTLTKLSNQLVTLSELDDCDTNDNDANKFMGLCLCAKGIKEFTNKHYNDIVKVLLSQLKKDKTDTNSCVEALETLREILSQYQLSSDILHDCANTITNRFLIDQTDNQAKVRSDTRVILQTNSIGCLAAIVNQKPAALDNLDTVISVYINHNEVAIRNQTIILIGNQIESFWRFPGCIIKSLECERIRKLWIYLRNVLFDETCSQDTLKSCVHSIRLCLNTLLESDHCLHIVEYQDINRVIDLYDRSNFKPFKVETLNLFASLNYRTLHYLERHHWSKLRSQTAGSLLNSLQDRIINDIIKASLIDEHQKTRAAATAAIIALVPNLYLADTNRMRASIHRPNDPIVSLANNLACEHMVVLDQTGTSISLLSDNDDTMINTDFHEKMIIRDNHQHLTSSIIQPSLNPCGPSYISERTNSRQFISSQTRESISINLFQIVRLIKIALEENMSKGKNTITPLVRTLYDLSLIYPIHEYPSSWDCRQSEYCNSFVLLNFLMAYLENLTEPDVIVEDLEAYRVFLQFIHQLLYALCHESVRCDYELQRMKPYHKRSNTSIDGDWSELTIKHNGICDVLNTFMKHLLKLLSLLSTTIGQKNNPYAQSIKTTSSSSLSNQATKLQTNSSASPQPTVPHEVLISSDLLFNRIYRKLETSYRSSKKNLNQEEEKFYQITEVCLDSVSSLLEFVGMTNSLNFAKDLLNHLIILSSLNSVKSLVCARQLLKSLFGINCIALYQVDPLDWFEEDTTSTGNLNTSANSSSLSAETNPISLQGVYHYLITNPYKIFSCYQSRNCSQITPGSDKALAILNYECRRALKVRRRIEDRVRSLFEINPNQMVPPKIRQVSEILKDIISIFTPIVTISMQQFNIRGFCHYQAEILHFLSYLLLLRVNFQKLALGRDILLYINQQLDNCGDCMYLAREQSMDLFLKSSFTFLTLLTYDRGASKAMLQVAAVIQKFDDLRAKLSMVSASERDMTTYIVPLLRCLVEDLFIYRTEHFQSGVATRKFGSIHSISEDDTSSDPSALVPIDQALQDVYDILEAERETIAQKLLDVIDNPGVYDLLSILILESRRNSSEIKYKKLSQQLLSIIPRLLTRRCVNLADYKGIELTRRILENISPEVFHPINFIIETLLHAPKPPTNHSNQLLNVNQQQCHDFQRWMSLVIIAVHILTTQVKEEKFLTRIHEFMSNQAFVEYLLHIIQLSVSEIILQSWAAQISGNSNVASSNLTFLIQQLSCYLLYITHMFQSGLFYQLAKSAIEFIKNQVDETNRSKLGARSNLYDLCIWARDTNNNFSLDACETMFLNLRLVHPDLTISWCNIMSLLDNVDCNRGFWRHLLVYECHHCKNQTPLKVDEATKMIDNVRVSDGSTVDQTSDASSKPNRGQASGGGIDRPSSLNLSNVRFSDQLRRSFIKRIATTESRDKTLNRNIVETSDEHGHLLERIVSLGNTEQCLAPNIELTRRGVLCLVLDYVSMSMSDVESITWLIIHHINDIIRWSHETPIAEFINAVHGNSASSGIFIQAINTNFNNITSISFVTRLLWTLEKVHYTQYGSLVVLLVEKLLSSKELMPYRYLTRNIEEFACATVQKLLNETNKSLLTTNEEVINQLTSEDLDRVLSLLDCDLYSNLAKLLKQLHSSSQNAATSIGTPTTASPLEQQLHRAIADADDSDLDDNHLFSPLNKNDQSGCRPTSLATDNLKQTVGGVQDEFPAVTHDILLKDNSLLNSFCERLLQCGWTNRRQFEETWMTLLGVLSVTLSPQKQLKQSQQSDAMAMIMMDDVNRENDFDRKANITTSCKVITTLTKYLDLTRRCTCGDPMAEPIDSRESLDERVLSLTNTIANNLSALRKELANDKVELDQSQLRRKPTATSATKTPSPSPVPSDSKAKTTATTTNTKIAIKQSSSASSSYINTNGQGIHSVPNYSIFLRVPAQKLRMSSILNVELDLQDTVVISDQSPLTADNEGGGYASPSSFTTRRPEEVDVESCLRLILSIYKQKLKDPDQDLCSSSGDGGTGGDHGDLEQSSSAETSQSIVGANDNQNNNKNNISLSDLTSSIASQRKSISSGSIASPRSKPSRSRMQQHSNQLAPPLTTAIVQSILVLSDMFSDYEQFMWMFDTFSQLIKIAERNEDEIQMQYLVIGLCKTATVLCYELPNELVSQASLAAAAAAARSGSASASSQMSSASTTTASSTSGGVTSVMSQSILTSLNNQREVMFEKCRLLVEKCLRSEFVPLKISALYGVFYMLEDSINIVASGAWELDDFKRLRQMRWTWIMRLKPIILDKDNGKYLSGKSRTMKLLRLLCETITETELKAMKNL